MRALGATLSKHGSSRPGIEMTASAVAKNHDGFQIFIFFFFVFLLLFLPCPRWRWRPVFSSLELARNHANQMADGLHRLAAVGP